MLMVRKWSILVTHGSTQCIGFYERLRILAGRMTMPAVSTFAHSVVTYELARRNQVLQTLWRRICTKAVGEHSVMAEKQILYYALQSTRKPTSDRYSLSKEGKEYF